MERHVARPNAAQRSQGSGRAAGGVAFFASHNAANVLNYAFLLLMSQALDPEVFSLFAALFAVTYLASAFANTAQVSVAAEVAGDEGGSARDAVVGLAARRLVLLLVPFTIVALAVAWPFAYFLHSTDVVAVLIALGSIWVFLLAAVGYGGLQGSGRFLLLGAGLLVAALGRVVFGAGLVWLGLGTRGALLGVLIGLALSAAVVLRPYARSILRPAGSKLPAPPMILSALVASIAIAIPTSADVVLVRHYFTALDAGAYAAVSVLGKVLIFGPMAIALAFFPSFVRSRDARPEASKLAAALGMTGAVALPLALAVIASGLLAPDLILRGYEVSPALLTTYVGAMAAFSLTVTLVYFLLATRQFAPVAGVPLGLCAQLALIALWHPGTLAVAVVLLAGNVALALFAAAASWRALGLGRGGGYRTSTVMVSQTGAPPTAL